MDGEIVVMQLHADVKLKISGRHQKLEGKHRVDFLYNSQNEPILLTL